MRFIFVSLLLLSVWALVERHNTAESNKTLEAALASERKAKQELSNRMETVAKELSNTKSELGETRDKIQTTQGQLENVQAQVGALANRPTPAPESDKKTWLQERIEQGNSLEKAPKRVYDAGTAPFRSVDSPNTRAIR